MCAQCSSSKSRKRAIESVNQIASKIAVQKAKSDVPVPDPRLQPAVPVPAPSAVVPVPVPCPKAVAPAPSTFEVIDVTDDGRPQNIIHPPLCLQQLPEPASRLGPPALRVAAASHKVKAEPIDAASVPAVPGVPLPSEPDCILLSVSDASCV